MPALVHHPIHPVTALFPPRAEHEVRALAEDIRAQGQLSPAVIVEGMLMDGRARQAACPMSSVDFRTAVSDRSWPVAEIVALHLSNRRLTAGQRAAIAVGLEVLIRDAEQPQSANQPQVQTPAASRLRGSGLRPVTLSLADLARSTGKQQQSFTGRTRTHVAQMVGVSTGYVAQANLVARHDPALWDELRLGKLTLPQAINATRQQPPAPQP